MKRKIDIIALLILIVGAINCGAIGIFGVNAVAWLFGGQTAIVIRVLYVIFAVAGLWCINLIVIQSHKRYAKQYAASSGTQKSHPISTKDIPENDTVCSASFSDGCVNGEKTQ